MDICYTITADIGTCSEHINFIITFNQPKPKIVIA